MVETTTETTENTMETATHRSIRPERTFERFNRGFRLVQDILEMWSQHYRQPCVSNRQINANIHAIVDEYDLTAAEWHYWCRQASTVKN